MSLFIWQHFLDFWTEILTIFSLHFSKILDQEASYMVKISIFYSIWYLNFKTYSVELMEGWMYKIFWWWYFQIWVAWFKNISLWRDFNLKKESSLRSRRLSFFSIHTFIHSFSNYQFQTTVYVRKMQSCLNAIKSTSCTLITVKLFQEETFLIIIFT